MPCPAAVYGPPAMALDSEPSLAPSTWFSLVRTASIEARMASMVAAEIELVSAPCSRRVRISLTATRYRRHSEACSSERARLASSASSSRRLPTLANDSRTGPRHAALANHDEPGLHHHHDQDGDDDPGVDRHGLEQEAQAAETEAGLLFVGAIGHQARFGALRGGVGQDQRAGRAILDRRIRRWRPRTAHRPDGRAPAGA